MMHGRFHTYACWGIIERKNGANGESPFAAYPPHATASILIGGPKQTCLITGAPLPVSGHLNQRFLP
jgi:hypothetical protein